MNWAQHLRRVFGIDVNQCACCGGRTGPAADRRFGNTLLKGQTMHKPPHHPSTPGQITRRDAALGVFLATGGVLLQGCASTTAPLKDDGPLVPIKVAGARWIEVSAVLVAANSFYPQKLEVASGGVVAITSGETDLATNAETQLLRESIANPDLRIIMTASESFYRLIARRSAGISKMSDLKGKRVLASRLTSQHYFVVAMLRSAGLQEEDVTFVTLPAPQPGQAGQPTQPAQAAGLGASNRYRMAQALMRGDVDFIAPFEPEAEIAVRQLGNDGIVFQDKKVYREAFNLHARAPDLADPEKRRAIVRFVRAVADASKALRKDPKPYLPYIASVTRFSVEELGLGWPETAFPVHIIPDMLDVLEVEEQWIAGLSNRPARGRAELAKFIDRSVVEEALKLS
jgi:sulfonate transport system substrate-binding protein